MKKFTLLFLTLTLVASSIQATDYVFRKKWDKSASGNGGTTPSHLSSINYGIAYKGGDRLGGFSSGYGSSGIIYKTFYATNGAESASGWPGQTMPMDIGGGIAIDENGYFFVCNASYSTTNSCKIKVSRTAGSAYTYDVGSIPGLSPATTQEKGGTRVGYGIDVKRNPLGNGFLLITTSVSSYSTQEANTGVIYYPITGSDLAYPVLGTPKKLVIPNLGVGVRVRIIDDTHFWIDGANTRPKLVTVTNWTTPTFTVAEFPVVTGGPNVTVRTDVADFNFKGERFVLMGTDYVNHKAGVFKIDSVTSTSISASNSIGEIGPLNTGSIAPHIISCATGVIDNSTNRKEAHLYVNSPNSGAISYIMEEAPAFNIIGTNGFPTSETNMTKVESSTTGTLNFTTIIEEVTADNPTFTIKHKNVQNADWHDNNKLGATNLTEVTCTNCTRSGTTFTVPSTGLGKAGKSLKITVTYTDDLNNSTPTKVYAVKCEEVPYRITYDSKGGSNIDPQDYEVTTNLTLASSPTKYGYTFAGWKVKATKGSWTVGTVYSSNQNVGTGNYGFVTLEAQWTPNQHTLTLDPNGGSVTPTTYTGGYGTNVTIADATRTGYRFGGWLQTKTAYDATWAQVFYHYNNSGTVLFKQSDNLAHASINDINKLSLLNMLGWLKYDANKYEFLLEYASFTGYNRWTQTSNPATSAIANYAPVNIDWTANNWGGLERGLTLYASNDTATFIRGSIGQNWFYAIGAYHTWSGGIPACHETESEKDHVRLWVRTADNFSNIGDSLTSALASDALTTDNKYIFRDEDATLKAIWMPNTYTVTYNGNGATGGSTANSSHIYNKPNALTTNGFTFEGYDFVGWSTSAGGDVLYTDGQSVSNLTPTHGGTVTLYAKWATGYRLHSGTGTTPECYSNALSYTGYFSLYHKQGDALTMQIKDEHNNWINLPGNIDCSITNTVIKVKFTYATKVLGTISEYTGDFFVRTNPADGGLDRYPEPYMDNKMSLLTGTAKYYWAKYAYPTTEMKTIVGNLYNPNISATLCDGQILNDTSAMRVNYDRSTNEVKMYQAKDEIASLGAQLMPP
ncbi:MAG: InlB B-repeat-containing protein [Paludibacteraceae bacterium]